MDDSLLFLDDSQTGYVMDYSNGPSLSGHVQSLVFDHGPVSSTEHGLSNNVPDIAWTVSDPTQPLNQTTELPDDSQTRYVSNGPSFSGHVQSSFFDFGSVSLQEHGLSNIVPDIAWMTTPVNDLNRPLNQITELPDDGELDDAQFMPPSMDNVAPNQHGPLAITSSTTMPPFRRADDILVPAELKKKRCTTPIRT